MKRIACFVALAVVVVYTIAAVTENLAGAYGPSEVVQREYCPMWKLWHEGRENGVPKSERYGWPDPDGRYYDECQTGEQNAER